MPDEQFTPRRPGGRHDSFAPALPAEEDAGEEDRRDDPFLPPSDERTMAVVCHIGGFFTSFFLPLIVWLAVRRTSRFLDQHGKEAVNFQLFLCGPYLLGMVVGCGVLGTGLAIGMERDTAVGWAIAGGGYLLALGAYEIVVVILASVAAWRGRQYRYPCIFRIIG
jgi:uncharacterized Tic20 family protein